MDWSRIKSVPKWNPFQFMTARHLAGRTRAEVAKLSGLSAKRYSDIENGNVEPTDEEVTKIHGSQTHVTLEFFEQWPPTTIDVSGPLCKSVHIDYFKYKVFRDINPPRMLVV